MILAHQNTHQPVCKVVEIMQAITQIMIGST
jgi:hypothetical protein